MSLILTIGEYWLKYREKTQYLLNTRTQYEINTQYLLWTPLIPTILDLITKLCKRTIRDDDKFQFHFIFGFQNKNFAEKLGSVLSNELEKKYPINDLSFTLLQGHRKSDSQNISNQVQSDLTIGDDIEWLISQLHKKVSTQDSWQKFNHKSHASSVIQKLDDTFFNIKCKRKSYTNTSIVHPKQLYKAIQKNLILILILVILSFLSYFDGILFEINDYLSILIILAGIPFLFYFFRKMILNVPITTCWDVSKTIGNVSHEKRFFVFQLMLHVIILFFFLLLILLFVLTIPTIDAVLPHNLLFTIWTDETLLYLTFWLLA